MPVIRNYCHKPVIELELNLCDGEGFIYDKNQKDYLNWIPYKFRITDGKNEYELNIVVRKMNLKLFSKMWMIIQYFREELKDMKPIKAWIPTKMEKSRLVKQQTTLLKGESSLEKYHQYKKGTVYFIVSVFILCLLAGCSSKQEETDLLKGWVGNYAFYDDFQVPDGPYMMVDYKLTIYEEAGEYYADMDACGQTTDDHLRAKVYGNDEWISLVFDKELEGNHWKPKDDTLLMSFRKDKTDIYT